MTVWQSLNAQVSPDAKDELFAGNINVFRCASCGLEASLAASFMYHDMELGFVAQYFPFDLVEQNDDSIFRSYNPDGTMKLDLPFNPVLQEKSAYLLKPHIVFSMDELIRYVIYRDKLALFHGGQTE